jgi:hypothetical protein
VGLSLGASSGQASDTKTGTSAGTSTSNFSPWQTLLQSGLGNTLTSLLSGVTSGGLSPNVQNMETANANQINETSEGTGTALNKQLAARGFGKSGQTGSAALSTELNRQSSLAQNASNASGLQLNQNQGFLSDALMAAFNSMGTSTTGSTTSNEQTQGTQMGVGASGSVIPGLP